MKIVRNALSFTFLFVCGVVIAKDVDAQPCPPPPLGPGGQVNVCRPRCEPDCVPDFGVYYQIPVPGNVTGTLRRTGENAYVSKGSASGATWGYPGTDRWQFVVDNNENGIVTAWDGATPIATIDLSYLASIPESEWPSYAPLVTLAEYIVANMSTIEADDVREEAYKEDEDWYCDGEPWWCAGASRACNQATARAAIWAGFFIGTAFIPFPGNIIGGAQALDNFQYNYCQNIKICIQPNRGCKRWFQP